MEAAKGAGSKSIVLASSIVVLALMVVLATVALASWPTADDYCNRVLVEEAGVAGALRWLFFEWSGRLVSGVPLYLAFALVDLPALRWVSLALACLFALAAWLLGSLLAIEDRTFRWPLSAFVFAALTLGLYRLLGQTVFWSTGGIVYMVPLVLTLVWLLSVRRTLYGTLPRGGNAYGFVLGLLVGNSIELVLPILAAYVALVVPHRWQDLSASARRALGFRVGGVIAGAMVLVAAPGNFARAKVTPDSFRFEPDYVVTQYLHMLEEIAVRVWPMVAIIGAFAIASLLVANRLRVTQSNESPSALREACALAIGAFASIVPVLAAPVQFAPRNGIYLLVFAFVAALLPLITYVQRSRWRRFVAGSLVGLAAAGAAIASVPLVADARLSEAFRERLLARDRTLRQMAHDNQTDATVPAVGLSVPRTLHFVEVDTNRKQWNNVCTAKYYGLRSIALDPTVR
jgi:type II secretory pathway pseudopilin PulG